MIVSCPKCASLISVTQPGRHVCRKCNALVEIGDPLKDEPSRVIEEHATVVPPPDEPRDDEDEELEDEEPQPRDKVEISEAGKAEGRKGLLKVQGLESSDAGVPWDRFSEIGFVEAVFQTTRDLIVTPTEFFKRMVRTDVRRMIPLYGIMFAILGSVFKTYWMLMFIKHVAPRMSAFIPPEALKMLKMPGPGELFMQVALWPIVAIIFAAFTLSAISMISGSRAGLHHYYRLCGFVSVIDLLYIVPVLGLPAVFIWQSVLLIKGIKVINDFTTSRAIGVFAIYTMLWLLFTVMPLISIGAVG